MLTNLDKIWRKCSLSFKFFFRLEIFWSYEWLGVRTFGQRGGALDLFPPLSSPGVCQHCQDGAAFSNLPLGSCTMAQERFNGREGGRETTASHVLVAFCLKDAEFQSQLFLFFICVREPCDVK